MLWFPLFPSTFDDLCNRLEEEASAFDDTIVDFLDVNGAILDEENLF